MRYWGMVVAWSVPVNILGLQKMHFRRNSR